jgi:hypothetical protein
MPIARPAVVVPLAARIRSGQMIAKNDCEAAVAIITKTYLATGFFTVIKMM